MSSVSNSFIPTNAMHSRMLIDEIIFITNYCCFVLTQSDKQNNGSGEWFINAEQFVATALTLQKLVEFIGMRPNISEALNKLRNN